MTEIHIVAINGEREINIQQRIEAGECITLPELTAELRQDKDVIRLVITPGMRIAFRKIGLKVPFHVEKDEMLFFNGYQSWTPSREERIDAVQPGLTKIPFKKWTIPHYGFDRYGDSHFDHYSGKPGDFHGWSWCYFRKDEYYRLFASLSEKEGFTRFGFDASKDVLLISRECEGMIRDTAFDALAFISTEGSEDEVFDRWFKYLDIKKPRCGTLRGYTSWYDHYQNISELLIKKDLNGMEKLPLRADIFQIDDGWEEHVGDWLLTDRSKFPAGMGKQAELIHERGYLAGLWLAPFVCERNSCLMRDHPDWLLRDKDGRLCYCGCNWSGFYALDWRKEPVIKYLEKVFRKIFDKWHYDMVKLDFLYAACMQPLDGQTRGQLMCKAMELLRRLCGDKLILACGVPLMPAFGTADLCRIGCDMGLNWGEGWLDRHLHPERVSTLNSLLNTIYRRQLNGRAFGNDPDVFLLRDRNLKLTMEEKTKVAGVNGLFGSLLFTSDDAMEYNDEQRRLYEWTVTLNKCRAHVETNGKTDRITYLLNDKKHTITLNR